MNDDEKNTSNTINTSLPNHSGKASTSGNSAAAGASTTWLRQKDPRIVRVCKALGGKDRHSKVCTIRGLRDRRVRLSVPTAIQLYDLQDRLGLNQPSKVVDWLLNAAKSEIDELPPLPISPSEFCLNPNNTPGGHMMLNWAEISLQQQQQQQQLWWNSSTTVVTGTGTGTSTSTAIPPTTTAAMARSFSHRGGMVEEEDEDDDDESIRDVNKGGSSTYGLVQAQNHNDISTMFNLGSGSGTQGFGSQAKDDHHHHHHQGYHGHHHQQLFNHQQQQQHENVNMGMSPLPSVLSLSNSYYPPPHLAAASAEVGPPVDNRSSSWPVVMPFHQLTELSMMSSRFSHPHHHHRSSEDDDDHHHRQE